MIPVKGLFLDCNPINQPPGTWRDGKNMIISKIFNAFVNEDGTKVFSTSYPNSIAEPIGATVFPDEQVIIYSDGKNGGKDRLGIIDAIGNYTDIIVDDIFGFDKNFPIRASEFDYNFLKQRIITWTDQNKTTKILNIDALPFILNPDKSLVNPSDINDINIFPEFIEPIITSTIISGGSVRTGSYSVSIAYENNDGTRTPNTTPFDIKYITDDNTSAGFDKFDGAIPNSLSNKAIQYSITNVDTRYDKLVLIIISKINNQITAAEIKKINISSDSLTITYLGTESVINLSLEQVLTPRPLYIKTGAMAKINKELYHGDLEQQEEIDFQSYANNIKIFYNSILVNVKDINNSQKNNIPGSFPHGGVVAFYIILKLTNGSTSRAFHIPGRAAIGNDTDSSSIASAQGLTGKVYQIEDTTNKSGTSYIAESGVLRATNLNAATNMGFWENEDEVYPTGFPGLAGQKVRHHVFPSIRKCKSLHYNPDPGFGREKLDILGIDVSNVVIPIELQDKVEGWYIAYAERNYDNVNIFGNDLLLYAAKDVITPNKIWSVGGNFLLDPKRTQTPALIGMVMREDYLRGHSFELLRDKPQIGVDGLFIDFELKIRKTGLLDKYQDVGIAGGNISDSGSDRGINPGGIIDLTDTINTTVTLPVTQLIRRISDFRYLPPNIIDGNYYTIKNEEAISMKIEGSTDLDIEIGEINTNNLTITIGRNFFDDNAAFPTGGEDTYLMTYRIVKTNLFANYNQQKLVATDKVQLPDQTTLLKVLGGDTFLSFRSFVTTTPLHADDFGSMELGGSIIRAHITESRYNIGLRYEISGNPQTKYYPKTSPLDFWIDLDTEDARFITDKDTNPNELGYSDDYNAVNNYIQPIIYEPGQIITNKFPYRVIRSGYSGTNSSGLNSWKTYLVDDFYESNRSRGKVENLVALEDTLLIHHYYGLYYTLGSQKLSIGATEVFLGTGDIFSQQPKEPISDKLGFLGNQNIFASFTFEGNYVWTDQSQGRIFMINKGGVKELSKEGMYNFFRDNLRIDNTYPNSPITGQSIIAGYDPKYKRLLFTKKSNSNPFTISYSLDYNCWVVPHDYIPNIYYNTTRNIFCIASGNINLFNDEASKGKYFGVVYPSYIDRVFNIEQKINKDCYNINWISDVYTNGVLDRNKTLTHLSAFNSYQTMNRIALIPYTTFGTNNNIRRIGNTWNFNKIRVSNSDVFKKKPLVDKYIIIRYEYDNTPNLDLSQNLIYLYDISCELKRSPI